MKSYVLFFSIVLLISCQRNHEELETSLDTLLMEQLVKRGPGCGIAVVKDGKTIFKKGYGFANLEHEVLFDENTVSDLGSVAKHFTAYAIAHLEEEGELDFDDEIQDHLDWIPNTIAKKDITISHLLHHTSGLREVYGALAIAGFRSGDGITQQDGQMIVRNSEELNFAPGEQYNYCNTAYMLLADIIMAVSGKSYEEYLQEHVFEPQDMDHAYIMDRQGEVFPKASTSYRSWDDGSFTTVYDNSTAYGQGGIYTSINDMTLWMKSLLNARGNHKDIFETMQKTGSLNSGESLDYAMGLRIDEHRGLKRISHSGASAGYRSQMSLYPDQDLGIFVQSNFGELNRGTIVNNILDVLIDSLPAVSEVNNDNSNEAPSYVSLSKSELEEYEGRYFTPELETVYEITLEEDQLMAHHRRNGSFQLNVVALDTLVSDQWYFSDVIFSRNIFGNADGFRLSNGRVMNLWFEKE